MTSLRAKRVLVVEDDYLLAGLLCEEIAAAGATVIGPAASLGHAMALARLHRIDVAVLDVNLDGELVFPVAELLAERGVALLFVTGSDSALIPRRFAQYATWHKPTFGRDLARDLPAAIRPPWLIAIGGSGAEGLHDLDRLLQLLPADLNAVVMAVLHRPWHVESHLRSILAQRSLLPVEIARDLGSMTTGHVYLGEPSRHLRLGWRHRAEMVDDPDRAYPNRTVDLLFDSLAQRGAGRTIGVILSGTLDDGTRGIGAMQADGGLAMTVTPDARNTRGMASNAGAGLAGVDFVGSPDQIAAEIERVVRAGPFASRHNAPDRSAASLYPGLICPR